MGLKADAPCVGQIDELTLSKLLLPDGRPQNKQPCGGVAKQEYIDGISKWMGFSMLCVFSHHSFSLF